MTDTKTNNQRNMLFYADQAMATGPAWHLCKEHLSPARFLVPEHRPAITLPTETSTSALLRKQR